MYYRVTVKTEYIVEGSCKHEAIRKAAYGDVIGEPIYPEDSIVSVEPLNEEEEKCKMKQDIN